MRLRSSDVAGAGTLSAAASSASNQQELFVLPFWSGRFLREAKLNDNFPAMVEAAKQVAKSQVRT